MKKLFFLAAALVAALSIYAADAKIWKVEEWDLAAIAPTMVGDTIVSSFTVDGLQVVAIEKRNKDNKITTGVMIDDNNCTFEKDTENEMKFTKRLKMMGASTAECRQINFPVSKNATVEIWARSAGNDDRTFSLGEAAWDGEAAGITSFTVKKSEGGYCVYKYEGNAAKLHLWVSAGVNIYGIRVTPAAATAIENAEVEAKAVKTFENGQLVIIKNGVRYNAVGAMIQ